ncbi:MAG: flagellar basal-body rod protein FlgG [Clostridiales bacterium]|jgi:flagellar basal-body rod protein FlgG|nr:flagellar basal-body rod protein FlgG [Clostridiales bacterium]
MMRSLWTAASGMISQQKNVDTISNNLANVNTYGYKKERMEFKTLMYDTMERANLDPANPPGRPANLQIGLGVRPVVTSRVFTQGNIERTDHPLDLTINGDGFFMIENAPDSVAYTKDGAIKVSPIDEGIMLTTSEGYPILSSEGERIILPREVMAEDIGVSQEGALSYMDTSGAYADLGMSVGLAQFPNVQGLEAIGSNLFVATSASGEAIVEAPGDVNRLSAIMQGTLEMSNVQVATEMVDLIVAQRAYELNSKAIQTSDEMLQQANNLKR